MSTEGLGLGYSSPAEGLEFIEMTTEELAAALGEGATIEASPTHDLHYEVSLEGVVQVVISALGNESAAQVRAALTASLDGASAEMRTAMTVSFDEESTDRGQAALLLRALDALVMVTGR
ncbi:hypothetical protein [Kitasatospora sp. MBT63]|uniref:hypothetical protein n=1 Tax=Kitasatospora TaxID=2063 RepID=UPI000539E493|nr:hypothetical protein [Kitasatospora sp. MBT63]